MTELDLDKQPVATEKSIAKQVPIIDIAGLLSDVYSAEANRAIEEIAAACKAWGFFQVINHGIKDDLIENVWVQTRHLFNLPADEKSQVMRSKENPWGFYNNELTKNQRDKKKFSILRRKVSIRFMARIIAGLLVMIGLSQ